jgi:hypothetical protein
MKLNMGVICALGLILFGCTLSRPARADETGCITVTGSDSTGKDLTDGDVYIEEDDGHGGWRKPDGTTKKHVGKADKGVAKLCGLKAGKTYRIIGRKDGDDNEGNWQIFVFQPDTKTKQMNLAISIKMKAKRKPTIPQLIPGVILGKVIA